MAEIDPIAAEQRLRWLAERYVPETVEEGRKRLAADRRLADEQAAARESFEAAAERRLQELRALCELATLLREAGKEARVSLGRHRK